MGTTALEAWAEARGLTLQEIGLKTKPLAKHFHVRKPGEKGTLEITIEGTHATYDIRLNRQGTWMSPELIRSLEELLRSHGPD